MNIKTSKNLVSVSNVALATFSSCFIIEYFCLIVNCYSAISILDFKTNIYYYTHKKVTYDSLNFKLLFGGLI